MKKLRSLLMLSLLLIGFGLIGVDTAWAQPAQAEHDEAGRGPEHDRRQGSQGARCRPWGRTGGDRRRPSA